MLEAERELSPVLQLSRSCFEISTSASESETLFIFLFGAPIGGAESMRGTLSELRSLLVCSTRLTHLVR